MAINRAFKISTILIVVLLVVSAVAFLLDKLGVLPVSGTLQKVPVVGKLAAKKDEPAAKSAVEMVEEAVAEARKSAAAEIERYKKRIGELEQQIANTSKEKELLEAKSKGLQTKADELQAWKNEQLKAGKTDFARLAKYYGEMKPAKAAEIMKNQSDEMNVGILLKMEDDQVAGILSAMDPVQAAGLVEQMNGQ